jgi:hypothetical protein
MIISHQSIPWMKAANFGSVTQLEKSFALYWVKPAACFENSGQPVMPPRFDKEYGLHLTCDGGT